jgi:hypothetical protein
VEAHKTNTHKERKEQNPSNGNVIFREVLKGKQEEVELDKEFLEKSKSKFVTRVIREKYYSGLAM